MKLSIVIPARNEEKSLPRLLASLKNSGLAEAPEVIVVDDASTDRTAEVAQSYGARVVPGQNLPEGWTGKTWACRQGAQAASGDHLLFLDADTFFPPQGLSRICGIFKRWSEQGSPCALSVIPFHEIERNYEELSAFFNLMMAAGTRQPGTQSKLVGQSLFIAKSDYEGIGGHELVKGEVLENFWLSDFLQAKGFRTTSLLGRGLLSIRMFPEGLSQLIASWSKAFAKGSAKVHPFVFTVTIVWISLGMAAFLALILAPSWTTCLFYSLYVLQLAFVLGRVGNFSIASASLYPIPLLFYLGIFFRSLFHRPQDLQWKGRPLA
jgi:4,4'-diaponeurosporenoate glycosyltransferase